MRILVVEDEHKIADAIKKGLEQENFAVDVAYDGEEGYDFASTEEYSVIVLDIMLPKMNGIEICTRLRKTDIKTPILMLTAKDDVDDKVHGLNSGADDYLPKPFAFSELVARIRALSRRPKSLLGNTLKVGNLELDRNTFEVTRDGKQISLSKKEFALLEFLLRNNGQTLSKDSIIQNVWNFDADVLPNTVEVYIRYLRQKIERPFPNKSPMIKTVRGFGYKIEQ